VVTEGDLSESGADVTWGGAVPLSQPFSVRDPLWAWGGGRNLTSGDGSAIVNIVAGLFFDGVPLLLLYALIVLARDTQSRRSQRVSVPAGANPGRSPPNVSSRSRSPRKRRSSPGTPRAKRAKRALTIAPKGTAGRLAARLAKLAARTDRETRRTCTRSV